MTRVHFFNVTSHRFCFARYINKASFFRTGHVENAVDESINLEHGDIVVLAVFECWEASTLFSKMDIAES